MIKMIKKKLNKWIFNFSPIFKDRVGIWVVDWGTTGGGGEGEGGVDGEVGGTYTPETSWPVGTDFAPRISIGEGPPGWLDITFPRSLGSFWIELIKSETAFAAVSCVVVVLSPPVIVTVSCETISVDLFLILVELQ